MKTATCTTLSKPRLHLALNLNFGVVPKSPLPSSLGLRLVTLALAVVSTLPMQALARKKPVPPNPPIAVATPTTAPTPTPAPGELRGGMCGSSASWIATVSPLNDASLVVAPDDTHQPVIDAINKATSTIYMEMYHLTDVNIVNALKSRAQAGVSVNIILDSRSLASNATSLGLYNDLVTAGAHMYKSTPQFSISHSKTFVIDQATIFISTMNLVGNYTTMRDYGIFTQDQSLIQDFMSLFQTDVQNSLNSTSLTPTLQSPNLIVSPTNSKQKLIDMITSASTSIDLTVENLGDTDVLAALKNAAACGVAVRIMTPECVYGGNAGYNLQHLPIVVGAGSQAKVMPKTSTTAQPYMHAKIIVVDNQRAYLGSENFSISSLTMDREMGVVVEAATVISGLETVFQRDWGNAIDFSASLSCGGNPSPTGN